MNHFFGFFRHAGDILLTIVTHKVFYITFLTWFFAQTLKVILHFAVKGRFDFRLFVGTGGMPSSHTAAVTACTVSIGLYSGWDSAVFMVCLMYCIVVISDAVGVRRAAGKQAKVLNNILADIEHGEYKQDRLKELLGHTPLEAFAGFVIGILLPVILF